jgi:FKBP-type peptidyl-prolyl cis-trans isomerase
MDPEQLVKEQSVISLTLAKRLDSRLQKAGPIQKDSGKLLAEIKQLFKSILRLINVEEHEKEAEHYFEEENPHEAASLALKKQFESDFLDANAQFEK